MNQEFKIGHLKIIQDEDGYGVMREIQEKTWEAIATFKYPEDAVRYFASIIMEAVVHLQEAVNINEIENNN